MVRPRSVTDTDLLPRLTEVFRASGFDGTSISTLAVAVGLRPASLYHRFPTGKEGLALAVLDDVEHQFSLILEPLLDGDDPTSDVAETARRLAAFYSDGRLPCVLESMTLAGTPPPVRDRAASLARAWVDAMAQVAGRAGLDPAEARRRSLAAFVRIEGSLVAARVLGDTTDFDLTLATLPDQLTSRRPA